MVTRHVAPRRSLRRRVAGRGRVHHRATEITEITELIWGLVRNLAAVERSTATLSRRRVGLAASAKYQPPTLSRRPRRALLNPQISATLRIFWALRTALSALCSLCSLWLGRESGSRHSHRICRPMPPRTACSRRAPCTCSSRSGAFGAAELSEAFAEALPRRQRQAAVARPGLDRRQHGQAAPGARPGAKQKALGKPR